MAQQNMTVQTTERTRIRPELEIQKLHIHLVGMMSAEETVRFQFPPQGQSQSLALDEGCTAVPLSRPWDLQSSGAWLGSQNGTLLSKPSRNVA